MASTNRAHRRWLAGTFRSRSTVAFRAWASIAYQGLLIPTTISFVSPGLTWPVTSQSHGTSTDWRPSTNSPLTITAAIQQVPPKCR